MSDLRRLEGERVFCHQCSNEWDRAQGGLTCPRCEGEFVEILSGDDRPTDELDGDLLPGQRAASPYRHRSPFDPSSPESDHDPLRDPLRRPTPFDDHNPWPDAPDPDEGDISTFQFSTPGGGRGTFSFTSRTYTSRGAPTGQRGMNRPPIFPFGPMSAFGPIGAGGRADGFNNSPNRGPQPADMQDLFSVIMQSMQAMQPGNAPNQHRTRTGFFVSGGNVGGMHNHPPSPLDLLSAILNPSAARGQHGDMVWSQEAFDRILEQLAEPGSGAPPPATEDAIRNLPKKKVDKEMLGEDAKAECSICMDNVELGSEVTNLPCNHWFHEDCVVAWLKEHDTCPHCRSPISPPDDASNEASGSRRQPTRHPSSVGSPFPADGTRESPWAIPESPTAIREARNRYYGRSQSEREREPPRRSDSPRRPSHPEQYYGGRHESTDYYDRPEPSRRHSSRQHSRAEAQSNVGGGVTGWIRSHLPGGGGSR